MSEQLVWKLGNRVAVSLPQDRCAWQGLWGGALVLQASVSLALSFGGL